MSDNNPSLLDQQVFDLVFTYPIIQNGLDPWKLYWIWRLYDISPWQLSLVQRRKASYLMRLICSVLGYTPTAGFWKLAVTVIFIEGRMRLWTSSFAICSSVLSRKGDRKLIFASHVNPCAGHNRKLREHLRKYWPSARSAEMLSVFPTSSWLLKSTSLLLDHSILVQ